MNGVKCAHDVLRKVVVYYTRNIKMYKHKKWL